MTNAIQSLGTPSPSDLTVIVELLRLLDYEVDEDRVAARLSRMTAAAGHETWVVRDEAGEIAGLAGGHLMWGLADDEPIAQLIILVVREGRQAGGIGSDLIRHYEAWARGHGASRFLATSAAARDNVTRFYARRGYHASGIRYSKLG
ncbi:MULTISPECIES: GNAT family N-acetyltransferase [Clavibacter]|uniref:GNAT family N-acetyltransferase n=2 Tax=Clavibacter TaxID=1573 RepID=A0A399P1M4_9MICO|nr:MULTISPECIES: GNAT family N-acetyltransferase [Clavibacter]KDP90476.1 acetyl transferase [Clavibacter cf. michiganensis LMG 26808]RII98716.1 GNAT family N-acetyltransferase [Clavibacter michiganensis]UKF26412.1 GNAT family N-acetyltransferase [Clavibacter sp. A6099]